MGMGRPGTCEGGTQGALEIFSDIAYSTNTCSTYAATNRQIYLPRDIGLPAAPGLAEVLQDGACLVLFDPLRHHVQDVVHYCRTQFQVKVALNSLLRDGLGNTL